MNILEALNSIFMTSVVYQQREKQLRVNSLMNAIIRSSEAKKDIILSLFLAEVFNKKLLSPRLVRRYLDELQSMGMIKVDEKLDSIVLVQKDLVVTNPNSNKWTDPYFDNEKPKEIYEYMNEQELKDYCDAHPRVRDYLNNNPELKKQIIENNS